MEKVFHRFSLLTSLRVNSVKHPFSIDIKHSKKVCGGLTGIPYITDPRQEGGEWITMGIGFGEAADEIPTEPVPYDGTLKFDT